MAFSQKAVDYACRDADATLRLYHALYPRLEAEGLLHAYRVCMDTMPLILAMERTGWRIDIPHFEGLLADFAQDITGIQADIDRMGFSGLNALSGHQVGYALFDELGLTPPALTKKTKKPSTEDKHLQSLLAEHPVVGKICDMREVVKLVAIINDILANTHDGHLRPRLNMVGTPTGRLSCRSPNLLAIPKHSDRGKKIRVGFLPPKGMELWSWDLSQVELRVLALESKDPTLVEVFNDPKGDLHAATAERIFGVKPEHQDKSAHRLPAKAVNFGIPMGISDMGLMQQLHKNEGMLHLTRSDCAQWLEDWHTKAYPQASAWLATQVQQTASRGYVECLGGRRRYLPGVAAKSRGVKSRAIRQCQSFPMQAGAQYLMHLWEAAVYREVVVPGLAVPILQIHDDLTMAGFPEAYDDVDALMRGLLPQGYVVPILASGDRGATWGDF